MVAAASSIMSDNGQEPPKVYHDVAAAFKFCRTLNKSNPIVAFYSPCLEPLPQQELDRIKDADYRIVAIVNTEEPSWWSKTNPDKQWDYGVHVQSLISHSKVAAVILRSKTNVSKAVTQHIDMYVVGQLYPVKLLKKHANDLITLLRDLTMVMYGIRPKYVIKSNHNVLLNASLKMFLIQIGCNIKNLICLLLDQGRQQLYVQNYEQHIPIYNKYILHKSNHYKYLRTVYEENIYDWVGGVFYIMFHDRSLQQIRNTFSNHMYYDIKQSFLYNSILQTILAQLKYSCNLDLPYFMFRGLGRLWVSERNKMAQIRDYILPTWFMPNFNLQFAKPINILTEHNNKTQLVATNRFELYTVYADHIVRLNVIRRADQKWE